ncbi:glycosyltransferase family 2 protein [Methanosphaerula palustris]|uniref:Glycosyl transferase family 2 n=1 Tax=Methanosphaerula palustris (strain ATCC BAA-1556 / DSM 19958 / E1-9c) TaxID=521011 RepID=B8GFE2_METPE|nr:glycosyltransferase [Methanosphaerula palustris]ACL15990.1 glycosyl transferase family 2 [Methanosphaerula palustris E1-9c]
MASTTPTVSVILPTYNRAHLLPTAIESVLNQTYRDLELIVVDDGSKDSTEEVIRTITDERLRYIRYEPNQGANHARNVGIQAARGPFIAFQDSDDDWFPDKLEKNMKLFEMVGPEVGVVYSGYWKHMGNNQKMYIPFTWVKQRDGDVHHELMRGNFVTTQAAVVRKECFEKSGLWMEGLPAKQEWELFLRISKDYKFAYIDEPLLNSNFTETGISNTNTSVYRGMEMVLNKHYDEFKMFPALLAEHYIRLGIQFASVGEFAKGRTYLKKGAALNRGNLKYQGVALLSLFGETIFNRMISAYQARDKEIDN